MAAVQHVMGKMPGATGLRTWTDAHNFVDLAGSEALIFGPGHLRRAHRPDESVDLHEVVTSARVLAQLLGGSSGLLEETS
jgi:acetylornithine deacetylase/succinyl-diaminopimelate desuccinylase-like protein